MTEKFKLKSEFKPRGDQPQAIKKLTQGVLDNKKYQTLLGITGSGKSVTGETPVLLKLQERMIFCPIGQFIDELCQKYIHKISRLKESEVILSSQIEEKDTSEVLSLNPITKKCEWKPILQLIRHASPTTLYHIKTTCGREVSVTADHNFWVLRDGEFTLLPTIELKNTDYIPLPLEIPIPERNLSHLNLLEILKKENLFVDAKPFMLKALSEKKPAKIIQAMDKHYSFPHQKFYQIKSGSYRGMPLAAILQVAQDLNIGFSAEDISRMVIGSQIHNYTLPALIPLSEEWLKLIGYYIAEGHGEPGSRFFTITAFNPVIQKELRDIFRKLGLNYYRNKYNKNDFSVSSKIHTILLKEIAGSNARSKKLPEFWPNLSRKQFSILLRAYFTGDGGAFPEEGQIIASTASKQLAYDIGYASLCFGIWARISRRWQRALNSPNHKGSYYWIITISGRENIMRFKKYIGFNLPEKQKMLELLMERSSTTNVDIIPKIGLKVKGVRKKFKVSQRRLAELSRMPKGTLNAIELGINNPRRGTFRKIIKGLISLNFKNEEIEKLKNLLNCRWTRIAEIGRKPSTSSYVYDLGVKDNETFLVGHGGLFVHNTFTMANIIANCQKPTLVISHNKLLAAQLFQEFKGFFPENAVEYFVSYYDYYQPEAYIPQTDTYIEKDASINDKLDRLRLSATTALTSRRDVIVVASVSCIYNLGSPSDYKESLLFLEKGSKVSRESVLECLINIHYERNDIDFSRGKFRVRGDVVEIFQAYKEDAIRVELFGDTIDGIKLINPLTGDIKQDVEGIAVYPAKHFVTSREKIESALISIEKELNETLKQLKKENKLLEAQRLESRTRYDMEMLKEIGYCQGVENYSRHLSSRPPGSRPYTLIDYFPDDFIIVIDESHVTIPQIRGMYEGDRSRKETLVRHGFRLPSCLDNRPLRFSEFESLVKQAVFVSATPGPHEAKKSASVVEQLIRPTGLIDPEIIVKPSKNQIDDLINLISERAKKKERVLVTTLTKRMAEDLSSYLNEAGLRVQYLHSEIGAIERVQVLQSLRKNEFDCLIGINLLREGLDLPEVSLICILDADKEGFLRSATSLVQVSGRAARNINGQVIMYADTITGSMQKAIDETKRRRKKQREFNKKNKITPRSIQKAIKEGIEIIRDSQDLEVEVTGESEDEYDVRQVISELQHEMEVAARNLQFEKAAHFRDQIRKLESSKI
ncbi:MAG: excinuclease ABC subunit UvrB [Candidatus Omnitrophota bacterium]